MSGGSNWNIEGVFLDDGLGRIPLETTQHSEKVPLANLGR